MSEDTHPNAFEQLAESAWAIRPRVLEIFASRARLHAGGVARPLGVPDGTPAGTPAATRAARGHGGGVAVIPLLGTIRPRGGGLFELLFGGTSVVKLRAMLREALADDQIGSIVLDVDSPGGQVDGIPELADEIRAARDRKPIVAVSNTFTASGAYWLASQASELIVAPSGQVGSIGVYMLHADFSGFDEQMGVDYTLIAAGRYKVEANEFEPLSDEARTAIQDTVDTYYDMFVADVAAGRDVDETKVRDGFGEGRMVLAEAAVAEGMADATGTLEDAISRAAELAAGGSTRADTPPVPAVTPPEPAGQPAPDPDVEADETRLLPATDDEPVSEDVFVELAATSAAWRHYMRGADR